MMSCRLLLTVLSLLAGAGAEDDTGSLPDTTPSSTPSLAPTILATTLAPAALLVNDTATDGNGTNATTEEYVDFLVTTDPQNISNVDMHFVVRITNPDAIATARGELNKTEGFSIVAGTIIKKPAPWNPKWSFYLDPDTVIFGDMFIEVCDANVMYVEDNLASVGTDFLPGNFWCPWSTRVLQELDEVMSDAPSDVPSQSPTRIAISPSPTGDTETPTLEPTEAPSAVPTQARAVVQPTNGASAAASSPSTRGLALVLGAALVALV